MTEVSNKTKNRFSCINDKRYKTGSSQCFNWKKCSILGCK